METDIFMQVRTRLMDNMRRNIKCMALTIGRKEGTCLFDINIKHNTEIFTRTK